MIQLSTPVIISGPSTLRQPRRLRLRRFFLRQYFLFLLRNIQRCLKYPYVYNHMKCLQIFNDVYGVYESHNCHMPCTQVGSYFVYYDKIIFKPYLLFIMFTFVLIFKTRHLLTPTFCTRHQQEDSMSFSTLNQR